MRILSRILDLLFPARDTEALVRDASMESAGAHVAPMLRDDGIVALLPYRAPLVKALIVEAKFRDNERAQRLLGSVLAEYLQGCGTEREESQERYALVPVPLSRKRLKERGYNQAERICRAALPLLPNMRIEPVLVRIRHTPPQTELGGLARRKNLAGAFQASGIDASHTYIVIDDVATTGATLRAAISALEGAGATRVIPLALAH